MAGGTAQAQLRGRGPTSFEHRRRCTQVRYSSVVRQPALLPDSETLLEWGSMRFEHRVRRKKQGSEILARNFEIPGKFAGSPDLPFPPVSIPTPAPEASALSGSDPGIHVMNRSRLIDSKLSLDLQWVISQSDCYEHPTVSGSPRPCRS